MKCPHCQDSFHPQPKVYELGHEGKTDQFRYYWKIVHLTCPACALPVIFLEQFADYGSTKFHKQRYLAYPRGAGRPSAPADVPVAIAADYDEACLVLTDSPKAAAALGRRCLQNLLRERGVSTSDNLGKAIDDALATNPPSHIAENLDAIRNVGNFAAHPQKSIRSGEILEVEPNEAEWNLDVLDMLFDFYYIQPAKSAARREALNKKLREAGKKPMKGALEAEPSGDSV